MKLFSNLLIFVFILLLTSCNDKEDGDVEGIILTVTPANGIITKNENEKIEFFFTVVSGKSIVKIEVIEEAENEINPNILFEETPNTTSYSGTIKFYVKAPPENSDFYKYTFTATDSEGTKSIVSRRIYLKESPLISKEAITLYSAISDDKLSGYSLTNQSVISGDTSLATLGFYEGTDTTANSTEILSNKWIGINGTSFVKNNSFKFEDATYTILQSTFEASSNTTTISNLTNGDVLLVKYKDGITDKYALIKLLIVTDKTGSNEDSYIFNLKHQ